MSQNRIALKPYLERIQEFCRPLSKEELTGLLVNMAKDVPTSQRVIYLERLNSLVPDSSPPAIGAVPGIDGLLDDIQALRESIEERAESIENGDYWDDPDFYDEHGYDDEDPDYVTQEQSGEIADFFVEAQSLFMEGRLTEARQAYDMLFELVEYIENATYFAAFGDLDIRENRANYARCVFETAESKERLPLFVEAMAVFESSPYAENKFYDDKFPLLQEVVDAREGAMEGLDAFLLEWKAFLKRHETSSRAASLFLEAVYLTDGIAGVSALARQWGNSQPKGYLFWVQLLKQENKPAEIIQIGKEALNALKNGSFREQAAVLLIDAAKDQNDSEALLLGRRERFFSKTSDQNLLDLMEEATLQNRRDEEIEGVLRFFEGGGEGDSDLVLFTKTLLMAGKLEEAVSVAKSEKGLGWSYGRAGVVFGAVLMSLSGWSKETPAIENLFQNYANSISSYSGRISVHDEESPTFFKEITKGLQQHPNIQGQAEKCLPWAEKIGKDRIDGIVSNQHRKAYARAAQVLGSMAEAHLATGNKKKARDLLHHYYHEKYNRHSAFRREVKSVVDGSSVLRACGIL